MIAPGSDPSSLCSKRLPNLYSKPATGVDRPVLMANRVTTPALNEADTCTRYVVPKLREAGWDTDPHSFSEQHSFTDGRIVVTGNKVSRRPKKRADYLLRYTRDFTL